MEHTSNNEIMFMRHGFDLKSYRMRPTAELKALSESSNFRMQSSGGIAIIPVRGPINRGEGYYGETDIYDVMKFADMARVDPSVSAALFVFDTPGGTASGCAAAAESIAMLSAVKPTFGYSFGCCSAGYYMASQIRKGNMYSSPDAMNGSIGTTTELVDASKHYESMGVTVHTIDTGTYKNVGNESQPVTPEGKAYVQGLINDLFSGFVKSVASGRKMSQQSVKDLEAKVFIGAKGIDAGLIDGVCSMGEIMQNVSKVASKASGKTNAMRSRELLMAKAKCAIR